MDSRLEADLRRLSSLAFRRTEWSEQEIRRYHELREAKGEQACVEIAALYGWMFVPITLWPFNIHDVFAAGLARLGAGKSLDNEMRLLLELLPAAPDEHVCAVVAKHEQDVQRGHYEGLVTTTAKFDATEKLAALDPALNQEWNRIKATWDVTRYCDHKGVIRRTLGAERNLRPSFRVNWKKGAERFQAVFDAFCLRWNLYGMQADQPLVMKLSVNLTPHGTMIFIPSYWSFDPKRDIRWSGVMQLHRARARSKQGPVLTQGVEERITMAKTLRRLDKEADTLGLKGDKRHAFLCKGLGWVAGTSPKRISRLRAEFKR